MLQHGRIRKALYLRARASEIRTEHYNPWCLVVKVFSAALEAVFQKLNISTTAITSLLVFDFVLNDQRFILEVDCLRERRRDGMVSSLILRNKTQVAFDDRRCWLFNRPFADVAEGLAANGSLLGSF